MSPANTLRVSVAAGRRRADVALPGAVPVALLVSELAGGLGAVPGAVLTRAAGPLDPDRGLAEQGVLDGAVLWLVPPAPPPRVYDDAGEAVGDLAGLTGPGATWLFAPVRAWARRRAQRRQGLGPVEVPVLARELRFLARAQVLLLAALAAGVVGWAIR